MHMTLPSSTCRQRLAQLQLATAVSQRRSSSLCIPRSERRRTCGEQSGRMCKNSLRSSQQQQRLRRNGHRGFNGGFNGVCKGLTTTTGFSGSMGMGYNGRLAWIMNSGLIGQRLDRDMEDFLCKTKYHDDSSRLLHFSSLLCCDLSVCNVKFDVIAYRRHSCRGIGMWVVLLGYHLPPLTTQL
jgi:hypothetical protein